MAHPNFILRPPTLSDVAPYTTFLADSAVSVWLDDSVQRPMSSGRVESLLLRDGWCLWSIECEKRFIGVASLYEPDAARNAARYSIVIGNRDFWGRGLGFAITLAVIEHAFQKLGLRKIVSDYLAPNLASAKLHSRCGFVEEGRLRQDAWREGRWVDRILLSIFRDETTVGPGKK